MADNNPFWNKLTKPIRDTKINDIVDSLTVYEIAPWDKNFNFIERLTPKQKLFLKLTNWLAPYFSGFNQLPEKYICNGNSDSLNHIFMNRKFKRVFTLDNEYNYYGYLCQSLGIEKKIFTIDTIDQITEDDLVCISVPNSYDGRVDNRQEIISILQDKNILIYIDVAYCGLTTPFKLDIKSTSNTYFAFTFSKSLSTSFNRIAVLYAGQPVPGLEIMNKVGYVNLSGVKIVNALMDQLPCDYIYQTYVNQYADICKRLNLTPTDCILFAHDSDQQKFCVSEEYVTE
jgi:histidinol-phosphate/aromatic aminotransferase/cobyric acid decarboxylase-like protein